MTRDDLLVVIPTTANNGRDWWAVEALQTWLRDLKTVVCTNRVTEALANATRAASQTTVRVHPDQPVREVCLSMHFG